MRHSTLFVACRRVKENPARRGTLFDSIHDERDAPTTSQLLGRGGRLSLEIGPMLAVQSVTIDYDPARRRDH
jgi:hypothetical protein